MLSRPLSQYAGHDKECWLSSLHSTTLASHAGHQSLGRSSAPFGNPSSRRYEKHCKTTKLWNLLQPIYILVCLILYLLWESPSIITRDVKPEMLIPFCRQSIGRRGVTDQLLSGVGFNTTDSCKCGVKPPTPDALKPEAIVGGDVAEVTLMTFWWCGFWWWWFWWYW